MRFRDRFPAGSTAPEAPRVTASRRTPAVPPRRGPPTRKARTPDSTARNSVHPRTRSRSRSSDSASRFTRRRVVDAPEGVATRSSTRSRTRRARSKAHSPTTGSGPTASHGIRSPASTLLCRNVPCSNRPSGAEATNSSRAASADSTSGRTSGSASAAARIASACRPVRPATVSKACPAGGSTHSRRSVPAASNSAFASGSERTDISGCSRSSSRTPSSPAAAPDASPAPSASSSRTAPNPSHRTSAARSAPGRAAAGASFSTAGLPSARRTSTIRPLRPPGRCTRSTVNPRRATARRSSSGRSWSHASAPSRRVSASARTSRGGGSKAMRESFPSRSVP